ncbi:MAG: NifB/NifX family molybdenum-iron cluster-binding protein [Bacilli bacterium]|nr:NifB/NifX family molybdenum-iron cluster-binding protein [Bacilli bacterium]
MRIACPSIDEEMMMEFSEARYFKLYDVDPEEMTILGKSEILNNSENEEEIAMTLKDVGVYAVVAALINEKAVDTLNKIGIEVFAGVRGNLDMVVQAFIHNEIQLVHNSPLQLDHEEGCGCEHHHHHEGCCGHHHHEHEVCCHEHHHGGDECDCDHGDEGCHCHEEGCDCHHHD